jgi:hypothetical protein
MSTRRRRGFEATALLVAIVAVSSCSITHEGDESGSDGPPPVTRDVSAVTTTIADGVTTTAPPRPLDYAIAWEPLDDRTAVGTLTVPVDYADPQGPTLDLRVARHTADPDQRIGVLATNNGGPGAAASTMAGVRLIA